MPTTDDLHDVLDDRARSADDLTPALDDVLHRARRRQRTSTLLRAAVSVAVIGVVGTVLVVANGDDGAVTVGTDVADEAPGDDAVAADLTFSRTLPDGAELEVAAGPSAQYGPYRGGTVWHPPARCPAQVDILVRRSTPAGSAEGTLMVGPIMRMTSADEVDDGEGVATAWFASPGAAPIDSEHSVVQVVVAVVHPIEGATYRLTDGSVRDELVADGPLIALSTSRDVASTVETTPSDPTQIAGIHLERIDESGATTSLPMLTVITVTPDPDALTCHPMVDESTWAGGVAPADAAESEAAIRNLVVEAGGEAPNGPVVNAVRWVSPTEAWVEYELELDRADTIGPADIRYSLGASWVDVHRVDGTWRLSDAGACAMTTKFSGRPGQRCER